jgi:hypothetical protein
MLRAALAASPPDIRNPLEQLTYASPSRSCQRPAPPQTDWNLQKFWTVKTSCQPQLGPRLAHQTDIRRTFRTGPPEFQPDPTRLTAHSERRTEPPPHPHFSEI